MLLNMLNDLAEAMKASDGKKGCISPNRYFIVSVFHVDVPEFFSFPYPRASFKVLNFSAYFPEFRPLVYFDRFVFICLFLCLFL